MKLLSPVLVSMLAFSLAAAGGCSLFSGDNSNGNAPPSTDGGDDDSGRRDAGKSSGTAHALGTITLGESHVPASTSSTPFVAASFIPDSSAVVSCATPVDGCEAVTAPKCTGDGGAGCGTGSTCVWDSQCQPTCQENCTATCASDEECYFLSPGASACRKKETFDTGSLSFFGTTSPLTLFPPYDYTSSTASGSLFVPDASLEVRSSGATGAGFNSFDQKFTATTFVQSNPSLSTTPRTTVFGTDAIPIGWTPGSDDVSVVMTGPGGVVTCAADDTTGAFAIPRDAFAVAMGTGAATPNVSISLVRTRTVEEKNATTHGTLTNVKVQPVGWLDLVTRSSESASFSGCPNSETLCSDGCFDTTGNTSRCGSCTNVCGAGETCNAGKCSGATACATPLIDDMEHGVSTIPSNCGRTGYWFVFNDSTVGATQTPSVPSPVTIPSGRSGSAHAAETSGSGFTNWGAGMGVTLNTAPAAAQGLYDASKFTGFTFWAKVGSGATTSVRMNVPTSATDPSGGLCSPSTKCDDHYGKNLTLSTTWTQYTVSYGELAQLGWGTAVSFDSSKMIGVQFQVAQNSTFEIWVDDISFTQ